MRRGGWRETPRRRADRTDRLNAKEPVAIDGGQVERIGLAGLQVLLAARASAIAAGLSFSVDPCSNRLADMADLAGLDDLVVH
jgi:anti-anti-sigma regulatory factor